MPSPLPIPPKPLAATGLALASLLAIVLALVACQPGSTPRSVPSVQQIGGDLKCPQGDHGYSDQQLGWAFCYPSTWRYTAKSQATASPSGVDLTFDITCISDCKPPCPTPGTSCVPEPGLFGFMIISTEERSGATDLATWLAANLPHATADGTIQWGNAAEAVKLKDGRRVALTPHSVVILDLHPSPLDLEGEMSSRLATWKFSY